MEVPIKRNFYMLIDNSTIAEISISKHMNIGDLSSTLATMVDPEVTCQQPSVNNEPECSTINTNQLG